MTKKQPDYNAILCRYSEIALKGKNRWLFEQKMIDRINRQLKEIKKLTVKKIRGRIVVNHHDYSIFKIEEINKISEALTLVFGLDTFSFAVRTESTIESIRKVVDNSSESIIEDAEKAKGTDALSYRIRVKRSHKQFPMSTKDTEIDLAELVSEKRPTLTVNLMASADVSIYCEIHRDETFIFYNKIKGAAGLPSGSNPPVLSLLSGGFDSSVASYMMMKRGVFVDYITFHSSPFTPEATVIKVKNLAVVLNKLQGPRRLFACNLFRSSEDNLRGDLRNFPNHLL